MHEDAIIPNCDDLGAAMAWGIGMPKEACLAAACHVLAAIAGARGAPSHPPPHGSLAAGGLVFAGPPHRLRALVDFLLRPVEDAQGIALAMRETHDPARLADFISERGNMTLRGETWAALQEPAPGSRPPPDRTIMLSRVDGVVRPTMLLRNPEPSQMEALLAATLDRSPLIVDERLDFAEALMRGGRCPIARGHAAWLAAALGGRHEAEGRGKGAAPRMHASRPSLLATVAPQQMRRLLRADVPELARILECSVVAEVPPTDAGPPGEIDVSIATQWLRAPASWKKAVARALEVRAKGGPGVRLTPAGVRLLLELRRRALDFIDRADPELAPALAWLANLPDRLTWAMAMIGFDRQHPDQSERDRRLLLAAADVFKWIANRHREAVSSAIEDLRANRLEMDKQRLLRALRRRGPCTWRELRRSFDVQALRDHEPAIELLRHEGVLQIEDGVFNLKTGAEM